VAVAGGWRGGWSTEARAPRLQGVLEAVTQCIVRPVVDDWVPATAADRQPMTRDPD